MQSYYIYIWLKNSYVKSALLKVNETAYSLAYGREYLKREDAIAIDPLNLPLFTKTFESKEIFNALRDSSPDRWGRYILEKKFSRSLNEIEFIMANGLDHVGALAFSPSDYEEPMRLTPDGYKPHLKHTTKLDIIMQQSDLLLDNESDPSKLQQLFEYGPSLGGARPKHHQSIDSEEFLAKYSVSQDRRREPLIEYACMKMASDLGLNVPEIQLNRIHQKDVFLIKRFDRENNSKQHFISCLSLCNWEENDYPAWSYISYVENLKKIISSQHIQQDLKELYRRIAFNIAVNNDDDHPRNHGVIHTSETGWRLSPLYDVVAKDVGTSGFSLAMKIGVLDRVASKENLLSINDIFRLEANQANKLIDEIFDFVESHWLDYFKNTGLSTSEIKMFELAMSRKAQP